MEIEEQQKGYVIVNYNHPNNPKPMMLIHTFRRLKRQCIQDFCNESGTDWKYWRIKYNFKCVRAKSTVETIQN